MKTIILPGYSPRNKDWAEEIIEDLAPEIEVVIHEWEHWSGGSMSVSREKKRILDLIGDSKINVIAKSVGTRVLMNMLPEIHQQVNKVILCGIPTKFESEKPRELYNNGLSLLSPSQLIILQNENDPLANFEIIEKFVHSVNPKIVVKKMPRSDHHYPYSEDLKKFLT
ncbi:hypothetical protein JXA63_02950 [Candidatus Woesebacteria bacterium]|nr:hypothetical protein [Candidatus Woesebacteria bacterium]